jgi:hypothetical protein
MGRFAKHIGNGEEIEIDGEKYTLKPLTTDAMPDFLIAMKAFSSGAKEGANVAEIFAGLNAENILALKNLIESTLRVSFPEEWKNEQQELKTFGMKYMMLLLPKILEINSAQDKDNTHEAVKKERIMERLSNAKSASEPATLT